MKVSGHDATSKADGGRPRGLHDSSGRLASGPRPGHQRTSATSRNDPEYLEGLRRDAQRFMLADNDSRTLALKLTPVEMR
jgi:hypothetical protein